MKGTNGFSRRDFLALIGRGSAGLVGVSLIGIPGFEQVLAEEIAEVPIVWIQGGACTGCSISVLNSLSPTIQDLILGEVVPGKHLSLAFHPNVMAGQGDPALDVLDRYKQGAPGGFVLVVEGAISTKDDGVFCEVGEKNGHGISVLRHLLDLAPKALAVVNIGTCSAYGGIPMAEPNPTGVKPVAHILAEHGIGTPAVNVPGCPPHPDWFVGTVATLLIGGLKALDVDEHGRLKAFFAQRIHDNCPFRGHFEQGQVARDFGEKTCLYNLGCRGPSTFADCPHRKWNSGVSWCIGGGSPCIGCVEPQFPYKGSLLNVIEADYVPGPHPPIVAKRNSGMELGIIGVTGAAIGAAFGIGIASARKKAAAAKDEEA